MRWLGGVVLGLCALLAAATASAENMAIVGAKLYPAPDAAAIEDAVIVVRNERIVSAGLRGETRIPDGYAVVNRPGHVVVAGFWNSHVHLTTPALLRPDGLSDEALSEIMDAMFSRWGFTTVFDIASTMASANAIRERIERGRVRGPAILTVGGPFFPKGGTPIYARPLIEAMGLPSMEIQSTEEAVARAARQIREGADGIKLFTGAIVGGETGVLPMPADQVRALAQRAHRSHLPVFAHPTNMEGLALAIDNGVDILAHAAPQAGPWPPELIARMKARRVALVPTLHLFLLHGSESEAETAVAQLRAYHDAGGEILFGTDAGYIDVFDPTAEYQLMARALDWRAILASLTTAPARRFGKERRLGRVAPGYAADLVILSADPAQDPAAFAKVATVIRGGEVVYGSGE